MTHKRKRGVPQNTARPHTQPTNLVCVCTNNTQTEAGFTTKHGDEPDTVANSFWSCFITRSKSTTKAAYKRSKPRNRLRWMLLETKRKSMRARGRAGALSRDRAGARVAVVRTCSCAGGCAGALDRKRASARTRECTGARNAAGRQGTQASERPPLRKSTFPRVSKSARPRGRVTARPRAHARAMVGGRAAQR